MDPRLIAGIVLAVAIIVLIVSLIVFMVGVMAMDDATFTQVVMRNKFLTFLDWALTKDARGARVNYTAFGSKFPTFLIPAIAALLAIIGSFVVLYFGKIPFIGGAKL